MGLKNEPVAFNLTISESKTKMGPDLFSMQLPEQFTYFSSRDCPIEGLFFFKMPIVNRTTIDPNRQFLKLNKGNLH
jgi:hypothetical protein